VGSGIKVNCLKGFKFQSYISPKHTYVSYIFRQTKYKI